MIIYRSLIKENPTPVDEDIAFSKEDFASTFPLLGVNSCHLEGEFFKDEGMLVFAGRLTGEALLSDARTCEAFSSPIDLEVDVDLLSNIEEEGEGYVFPENKISTHDLALCLIRSSTPIAPLQEGSKLPSSGEGYTVSTEEEYVLPKDED